MKYLACLVALGLCFTSTGCQNLTPAQKAQLGAIGTKLASATLNTAQVVTNLAVQVVVAKATSTQDLTGKSNLLDSAAQGLRTLQGQTDGLVTPAMVQTTVAQFTDPTKEHWGDLATQLAQTFSTSPGTTDAKLEAMASGLNNASSTATAVAAVINNP